MTIKVNTIPTIESIITELEKLIIHNGYKQIMPLIIMLIMYLLVSLFIIIPHFNFCDLCTKVPNYMFNDKGEIN